MRDQFNNVCLSSLTYNVIDGESIWKVTPHTGIQSSQEISVFLRLLVDIKGDFVQN